MSTYRGRLALGGQPLLEGDRGLTGPAADIKHPGEAEAVACRPAGQGRVQLLDQLTLVRVRVLVPMLGVVLVDSWGMRRTSCCTYAHACRGQLTVYDPHG